MFEISRRFFAVGAIISGGVSAYTLVLTSCDYVESGTTDTLAFSFCSGGTYCTVTDTMDSPGEGGIEEIATPVEITVSFGYVPTTMEISNPDGTNAWCVTKVEWGGGDNILGQNASIWFDSQTGYLGCADGLIEADGAFGSCQQTWRFFNLDGASDYLYDVNVKACSSTKSASVKAFFCATYACDGTDEEESITLTMGDEEGGWTATEVPLTFNPIGIRLEGIDDTWCADEIDFNGFLVLTESVSIADFDDMVDGTASMIVNNIQANGLLAPTPSPVDSVEEEDDDGVLDATPSPTDSVEEEDDDGVLDATPSPTDSVEEEDDDRVLDATPSPTDSVEEEDDDRVLDATTSPVDPVEKEDDDRVLDATWEVAVTVIGAVLGAAGAAIVSCMYRRWPSRQSQGSIDVSASGRQPVTSDIPRTRMSSDSQPPSFSEPYPASNHGRREENGAMEARRNRTPPPYDADRHQYRDSR